MHRPTDACFSTGSQVIVPFSHVPEEESGISTPPKVIVARDFVYASEHVMADAEEGSLLASHRCRGVLN